MSRHVATGIAPRRSPSERWVLAAAAALIVLHLGFRAWATYGGYLHIDDFNFISRMTNDGLSPAVAARTYYGHVMPAAMYLSWLNQTIAPWNWPLPATELLALQALCDVGLLYLLRTLFGTRPGILPPLVVFLATVISLEGSIWWAAAINLLPFQAALFFGLAAHVHYLRTGRFRHAVAANVWIVAGIAFNEKAALVYGALGIVTLCYFATGRNPLTRVRTAVHGRLPAVALYALTGAAYVAVYLSVGREFTPSAAVSYPVGDVANRMVLDTFVPGILGGPLRWWRINDQPFSFALPGDGLMLVALAVLLVFLWEVRKHRRRALRALWLPAYFLVIDMVLVLVTRASVSGALVGLDYRFQGELAAASAIALGCMTMPVLGAAESSERRSRSELLDRPRFVVAATVAVLVLGTYSSWSYTTYWHEDRGAERWFDTLVPQLRAASTPIPLVDRTVPFSVTNGVRFPENLMSHVLASEDAADFTQLATDRIDMIDDDGIISPAVVPPVRKGAPGPRHPCGYLVDGSPVTIPLAGPVAFGGWWVRIGYLSSGDSPVTVTAGDATYQTTVRSGVHALYFEGGGIFKSVTIGGLVAPVTLCTDDVTVGRPEPSTEDQP